MGAASMGPMVGRRGGGAAWMLVLCAMNSCAYGQSGDDDSGTAGFSMMWMVYSFPGLVVLIGFLAYSRQMRKPQGSIIATSPGESMQIAHGESGTAGPVNLPRSGFCNPKHTTCYLAALCQALFCCFDVVSLLQRHY